MLVTSFLTFVTATRPDTLEECRLLIIQTNSSSQFLNEYICKQWIKLLIGYGSEETLFPSLNMKGMNSVPVAWKH